MTTKNPTSPRIAVWIVEDNRAFSRNAAAAINDTTDLECTGTFRSCEDALAELKNSTAPRVVLMDIGLPGMSGIEGIRRVRDSATGIDVVVLTVFEDEESLKSCQERLNKSDPRRQRNG